MKGRYYTLIVLTMTFMVMSSCKGKRGTIVNKAIDSGVATTLRTLQDYIRECESITYSNLDEAQDTLICRMNYELKNEHEFYSFVSFLNKEPKSLDYDFSKIQDQFNVKIKTSDDKNFRVYSWGYKYFRYPQSRYDNRNLIQYRQGGKVYLAEGNYIWDYFVPEAISSDGKNHIVKQKVPEYPVGSFATGIDQIRCKNGKNLYLVSSMQNYGGIIDFSYFFTAYTIEDTIILKACVFNDGKDITKMLADDENPASIELYLSPAAENGNPFTFNKNTGILTASHKPDQDVIDIYQFNGYTFDKVLQ